MSSILITPSFTAPQLQAFDNALLEAETQGKDFIALTVSQKRSLRKMGERSEAFCRQALRMAEQNPHIIPPNIPVAEAVADLKARDELRSRLLRLSRLCERAADTDMALGSNIMTVALKVYGQLKLTGRAEGLDPVLRELGGRFTKSARQPEASTA
jgi:hypothetical protein